MSIYRLGIDLGGTKTEGAVLDESGKIIFRERILTQQEEGYSRILANLKHLYSRMAERITEAPHTLGIGTPGALSHRTGLLKNSNTLCLNGKLSLSELEDLLGRPLTVENDANCFALAEALYGAGRGKRVVFGVILGTGCGGGVVIDGKVLRGLQSIAGEWGHSSIDPAGPECYCGARGCVETFISGGGGERWYAKIANEKIPFQAIVSKYRAGEKNAVRFMASFFESFGRALANVIHILDPDVIVLGGGLSNMEEFYTLGVQEVKRVIFSDSLETPIVKHELGDSAGVIGAAMVGR